MPDPILISKLLPLLVYPLGLALLLMLAALLLLLATRRRWPAALCIGLSLGLLLIAGNPYVAGRLYAGLERTILPTAIQDTPSAEAIVMLGGGLGLPLPPRLDIDLRSASDRIRHTAQLYHAGKAPRIVITGGNVFPQSKADAESVYVARLLQEWGVPADAILVEPRSRNTYQNATYTRALLEQERIGQVLLVTSALHMPRAAAVFRSAGVDIIPSPTDFNMVAYEAPAVLSWIPSAGALSTTTLVIKEYLGTLYYRLRGWLD